MSCQIIAYATGIIHVKELYGVLYRSKGQKNDATVKMKFTFLIR